MFGQNMVQHGSAYKVLDKIGCMTGEDVEISNNIDKLVKVRENIRANLTTAHKKATKVYNLRSRPISFKKGQIVYRKNHIPSNMSKHINRKFLSKYLKCWVREKVGNNLYNLEDENGKLIGKFHASDIKC